MNSHRRERMKRSKLDQLPTPACSAGFPAGELGRVSRAACRQECPMSLALGSDFSLWLHRSPVFLHQGWPHLEE